MRDNLTDLKIMKDFKEFQTKQYSNKDNLYILELDISKMMSINDCCGHLIGDLMILEAVDYINSFISKDENVYRIGGNRFVIVTPYRSIPYILNYIFDKRTKNHIIFNNKNIEKVNGFFNMKEDDLNKYITEFYKNYNNYFKERTFETNPGQLYLKTISPLGESVV